MFIQFGTGRYAAKSTTNFVGDLFLDNLPVYELDFLIIEGSAFFVLLVAALFVIKPHYLLFGLKAFAFLIVTRALFITLTHLGIYPEQISFDDNGIVDRVYRLFDLGGDFFFSGHTAFPFLAALVFWPQKFLRYLFFGLSAFFGTVVLFAHVHYSIDVFAAPFITYGIFKMTQKLFARDFLLTQRG